MDLLYGIIVIRWIEAMGKLINTTKTSQKTPHQLNGAIFLQPPLTVTYVFPINPTTPSLLRPPRKEHLVGRTSQYICNPQLLEDISMEGIDKISERYFFHSQEGSAQFVDIQLLCLRFCKNKNIYSVQILVLPMKGIRRVTKRMRFD